MSKDQSVHLIIRNTREDDIEKIVKLQQDSFPILARYDNIWHPEELKSHLQVFPLGQFVVVEEDGEVVGLCQHSDTDPYSRICRTYMEGNHLRRDVY